MNFIKANRDQNVLIKEIDKYCIHVRLMRVAVDPADPVGKRSEDFRIQIFSEQEWDGMQKRHATPDAWVKIGGYTSAVVVHDGRLEPKEEATEDIETEALQEVVAEKVKEAVKKEKRKQNFRKSLQNTAK